MSLLKYKLPTKYSSGILKTTEDSLWIYFEYMTALIIKWYEVIKINNKLEKYYLQFQYKWYQRVPRISLSIVHPCLLLRVAAEGRYGIWKFYCYVKNKQIKLFDETFSLPTDAHNVKKHRVIKTF